MPECSFSPEVHRRIGEYVSVGRGDRSIGNGGVSRPGSIRIFSALPAHKTGDVLGSRVVLGDFGDAVVIPVVGVGDIGTVTVLEFNFEPMTFFPGCVDGIEVVEGAVGAGMNGAGVQAECQRREQGQLQGERKFPNSIDSWIYCSRDNLVASSPAASREPASLLQGFGVAKRSLVSTLSPPYLNPEWIDHQGARITSGRTLNRSAPRFSLKMGRRPVRTNVN